MSAEPSTSEINAALARWDGFVSRTVQIERNGKTFSETQWNRDGVPYGIEIHALCPDYFADLNLIHGLEEKLTDEQQSQYVEILQVIQPDTSSYEWVWEAAHASANDKSRALYQVCPTEFKV